MSDHVLGPVVDPDPIQQALLDELRGEKGSDLNLFRTLAHHPTLLRSFRNLSSMFRREGRLPLPEQEVIVLRTAARARCRYVLARHALVAESAGLPDDEIAEIVSGDRDAGAWWNLMACAAEELWANGRIEPRTFAMLSTSHCDLERLEVLFLGGLYRLVCGAVHTLDVDLEQHIRLPVMVSDAIDLVTNGRQEVS